MSSIKRRFSRGNEQVLGYVGSLFPWEGLDLLLRTLAQLRAQGANLRLLIVGTGPQESELKRATEQLGIAADVQFTGRIEHDEAIQIYEAIDLLVYPRLRMRLTDTVTPLKPLEAMARRKPLIASDVGGHRELIRDGETGVLFRAGDPGALAHAITRMMQDEALRNRLVENGARFLQTERLWTHVVPRYEPIYRKLVAEASARG